MSRLMLLVALGAMVACAADEPGLTDDTDVDTVADTDTDGADIEAGATVFANNCVQCHGADGTGVSGPNLNERAPNMDAAAVKSTVLNGKNYMPAIEVTDEEATDVAAFVIDEHG